MNAAVSMPPEVTKLIQAAREYMVMWGESGTIQHDGLCMAIEACEKKYGATAPQEVEHVE
jgi:hypothetical protein